jgi:hypothetical protein
MAGSESAGGQATQAAVAQRAARNARLHARASAQSEPIHVRHEQCMGRCGAWGHRSWGGAATGQSRQVVNRQALQHCACILKRSVSFVVARRVGCQAHATLHKAYVRMASHAPLVLCLRYSCDATKHSCMPMRAVACACVQVVQTCAARQLPALAHSSTLGVQLVHRRALQQQQQQQQQQQRDACMRCALMRFVHGTTCIQLLATF